MDGWMVQQMHGWAESLRGLGGDKQYLAIRLVLAGLPRPVHQYLPEQVFTVPPLSKKIPSSTALLYTVPSSTGNHFLTKL
jgi:hypothetical protein